MSINLEEYSSILKESAYILGDCSLIDDLNIEVIDWQLGNIGANMKSLLKEKKRNNKYSLSNKKSGQLHYPDFFNIF